MDSNKLQTITIEKISDKPFARGGEGCVYDIIGASNLVAKIYHEKGRTAERERKIQAMLNYPPEEKIRSQIAWPMQLLYDIQGDFFGYVMPRIKNVSKIDILYSYDNRNKHPWKWYIQVAQNLCAAVDGVHKSGHVCGDLNPANICANEETGLITLVDTDSYHIKTPYGEVFPCGVGMLTYMPPELHRLMNRPGFDLRKAQCPTFTKQTDNFALAVHIYALLMNGCHPFACSVLTDGDNSDFSLERNIAKGIVPFAGVTKEIGIPKYSPFINILTFRLKQLFFMAFVLGQEDPHLRPTARQWYEALDELEQSVVTCGINQNHQYLMQSGGCPWCEIDNRMRKSIQKTSFSKNIAQVQTAKNSNVTGHVKTGSTVAVPTQKNTRANSGSSQSKKTVATNQKVQKNKKTFSAIISGSFGRFTGFLRNVGLFLTFLILWFGCQGIAFYLIHRFAKSNWKWILGCYAGLGILPYIPLWIVRILLLFPFKGWWLSDLEELNRKCCNVFGIVVYGLYCFLFFSDKGLISMILMPVLVVLPMVVFSKWFPDWTS